ncbi:unnamed protein product [Eruca vesicaria subsp. sativa]|uniref:J domain-containing protein n=1 Tax=Eruca vesicaria subsp. sativa TaxID=29727 RepID=A0ABC8JY62_ERUVS|nr:unnamed protein product [Eruca vesicaria subsp. sativa]
MENLSHSRSNPNRSKKPSHNVNGKTSNTATTYDDVFGGPPRFGPPTLSPRLEDYCEIFSGFNGSSRAAVSSIPVLDLPIVDDSKGVYFDVRRESFDYREVFGGFNDLDFAPSYEELFMQRRSTTVADGDSSDDAWTPEEVETEHSEKSPSFSNGRDSYDSVDGCTEFNISYNKATQMNGTSISGGVTRVADLGGYTVAVDEMVGGKKETGPSSVGRGESNKYVFEDKDDQKYYASEPFVTVSEIGLRTHPTGIPPPSRPPPVLMKSDFRRSGSNSRTTGSDGSMDGSSPPFFDVEVDASSAAVRDAMVKAEAKLKSAKELFEKKQTSMNNRMSEEGKSSHAARKPLRAERGSKSLSSQGSVNSDGNEEWEEATQFVELVRTEQPRNADENSGGEDVSFPLNSGFFDQKLSRAKGDREDHEGKKLPKHPGTRKVASRHKRHEDRHAKRATEEPKNEKLRDVELQFEIGNSLTDHGGIVKQRNLIRPEENKHFSGEKLAKPKNQDCVFDWEQNARKLREALGLSDNESTLEVPLGMNGEMDESETKLKEALRRVEEETSSKEACVMEEREKAENEKRLHAALEQEEKVKKLKEAREKEENERKAAEARQKAEEEKKMKEQEEYELRLKEAFEKEEENRRMREARDKAEQERRRKEQEEYERKLKEAFEKEEKNRKMREAREKAENEMKMKVALEQEKERKRKEAREKEENERRIKEAHEKAEMERRMKELQEREAYERRMKELQEREAYERRLKEALEQAENERRLKEAREKEENEKKLKEAIELEEKEKRLIEAFERAETERRLKEELEQEEMRLQETKEREERERTLRENQERQEKEMKQHKDTREAREGDTCEMENTCETTNENGGQWLKENLSASSEEDERVENHEPVNKVLVEEGPSHRVSVSEEDCHWKVFEKNLKDASQKEGTSEVDAESRKLNGESGEESASVTNNVQGGKLNQKSKKSESNGSVGGDQRNPEESKCATNKASSGFRNHEDAKIERPLPSRVYVQREKEAERLKRELDTKMERLRKIEEEREREREREKDRMAFDQRALADARERLEKACAEARERSFPDKAAMEARLKAERAAVERATAEARERAAEKAAFEARDRMERSVSDKQFQSSGLSGERMERSVSDKQFQNSASFGASRFQNSPGADGESPQRYTSRLERHRRTADRVAKALAEKNMRDLVAQREQAERNRIGETLDAEVKRWSSGKEGNIRALLSTLQYILGSESGWQPIHLTEVITSAAVKRAYRKATLCVHPDKLQQRGANIHQKYICEKVFDLLKEAWNRFNSEER